MQNIDLICVGKLNAKYFAEGVAEYQKRLAALQNFRIRSCGRKSRKNASAGCGGKSAGKEAKAILSNVLAGAAIVAFVRGGKSDLPRRSWRLLAQRAGSGAGT